MSKASPALYFMIATLAPSVQALSRESLFGRRGSSSHEASESNFSCAVLFVGCILIIVAFFCTCTTFKVMMDKTCGASGEKASAHARKSYFDRERQDAENRYGTSP
uniref:Protein kish n=1 Tax=Noctiluca scintillans TaxID=2966 RepID=A0A7S1FBJ1_NOCSC|mmetsp:Transcript_50775/g.135427  ORF Transcript_50775/g.135427 Transcript_50775/m.135427 type:complete len:106 (+) Transcript_50775:56-373(+)